MVNTDLDRVRAVLDRLADDTLPPCRHDVWVDAHRDAIDRISRIAYPEGDQ